MRLLLFDIDGTLIKSGGAGARALRRAFSELHGLDDAMHDVGFAGKTDPRIVQEIFRVKLGREAANGETEAVLDRYLEHLREEVHRGEGACVLPGIVELLERLNRVDGVLLGLLTGNIEGGARIKLGRFDLNRFFPFGGFASDSDDRAEIAGIARARGRAFSRAEIDDRDVVVIGDTPLDVACGRAIGATTVAVGTGFSTPEELRRSGPDWHLDDLGDTARALEVLAGGGVT